MEQIRLQKGDKFKIQDGHRIGEIYTCDGFGANKWGIRYCIARRSERPGDCELFSAKDLNEFGDAFRLWDTSQRETEAAYFERVKFATA